MILQVAEVLRARIADLKGSQTSAARTLGVNQSTVSRALRERPELP
ncbi:hypothetical protein [Streptomyces hirsutus]